MSRSLLLLAPRLALASLVVPTAAVAQDFDADGAPDVSDVFPCDAARAAVSFYPAAGASALLVYEDQWPSATDLDFNDVAVRVHHRIEHGAVGDTVELATTFDPVALGGEYSNGLALRLPVTRSAVTSVARRVGGGPWTALSLAMDTEATFVVSQDLRELFGDRSGPINALVGPHTPGARLEVRVTFASGTQLATSEAPFDAFVFRTGDFSHQIHFPRFAGTAAFDASLFGTVEDGSRPGRWFVNVTGIPAALNLATTTYYPREGVDIAGLFPAIVDFGASGGAVNQDFYTSQIVAAAGIAIVAPPVTAPAPDTSCIGAISASTSASVFAADPTLSQSQTVTLTNDGGAPVDITDFAITGAYSDRYAVSGCDATLVGGATCDLTITFTPGPLDGLAGQDASLAIAHTGANASVTIALSGSSAYTPAVPSGPSGATPPSISGDLVSWGSSASYGGFTVGRRYFGEGRFVVSFTGSAWSLSQLEYNFQTPTPGTYYGVSFRTGRVVRGGSDIVNGAGNGATFSRPQLANNDRILVAMDATTRDVAWYHCTATTCAPSPFHAVTNLVPSNRPLRVYSYKTGSGGPAVRVETTNIVGLPAALTGWHNGTPE